MITWSDRTRYGDPVLTWPLMSAAPHDGRAPTVSVPIVPPASPAAPALQAPPMQGGVPGSTQEWLTCRVACPDPRPNVTPTLTPRSPVASIARPVTYPV